MKSLQRLALWGIMLSGLILNSAPASAANCVNPPAGLVAWWTANGTTNDHVSGNIGTATGITFAPGAAGLAFNLNASHTGVSIGNPTNLQLQDFTIEAWIKRSSASLVTLDVYTQGVIFGCYWGGYSLGIMPDGRLYVSKVGYSGVYSTALTVTDTNFHHVAATKVGTNVVFYVDGAAETVEPYEPGFIFNGPSAIGARGGDLVCAFWGLIDEVSIYNRALSAGEVQSIYAASSAGKCLTPAGPTNPNPDRLVWIAPGTFTMGSPDTEQDRVSDEGPQTHVTLNNGFFMGKYEVTQGEFAGVMGSNPSYFTGNTNLPVETTTWNDATNYCALLTAREIAAGRLTNGWVYRLPTEAEWEYACRAGTTNRFSFGDDPTYSLLGNYAWYNGNSGSHTHPVGTKLPNPWGLYDMHGNVIEWCSDWYSATYPGGSVVDPQGPASGTNRPSRGGNWEGPPSSERSALRIARPASLLWWSHGFRVVLARSETPATPTNPDPARLAWINPGTFTMGSPATEQDRQSNEGPQMVVTLSNGFFMGKYEVSQSEYLAVVGSNPSYFHSDTNLPVDSVTWNQATNYCALLTARETTAGRLAVGWLYRLPTEAEWEYACRAGTTNRFSYGDDPSYSQLGSYAWYIGNSGDRTHPLGGKLPNAWGLYDMHGNLGEWCLEWYGTYPGGSVTNPAGPAIGSKRVLRGSSFHEAGHYCRSAERNPANATDVWYSFGFRVVLARLSQPAPTTNNPVVPQLVWVAPGSFTMGSPDTEQDRRTNEGPQTRVTLNNGFFMGKYELTQGEFLDVVGGNPSYFQGDLSLPVDTVTWNQATNYCALLTAREVATGRLTNGWVYRLPTEAEWEYACRAGSTNRFSYGDDPTYNQLASYAWYSGNGGDHTHPVGTKLPNAWGLYDMHGNVNEWCLDWYGTYPGGSVTDPAGPATGDKRIVRSHSFHEAARYCRSAERTPANAGDIWYSFGFRVVLAAPVVPPVVTCVTAPSGLVAWWPGNGTAEDVRGGNNGILVNATYTAGKAGQAFHFDNAGDAVAVGNPVALQLQDFTIEAWIKRSSTTQVTLDGASSGAFYGCYWGGYGLGIWPDGRLYLTKSGYSAVFTTAAMTDTNFHHVAATKVGSNVVIYVDGVGEAVGPYDPDFVFNGPSAIGARGGDHRSGFYGSIDEMSIYNRSLTAAEIQSIYTASSAGKCDGPRITEQPRTQVSYYGRSLTLSVTAVNTGPVSYQWFKDNEALAGETNRTLTIPFVENTDAGIYKVTLTGAFGTLTSAPATLTVEAAPISLAIYPGCTIEGVVGQIYGIQSTTNLSDPNSWEGQANIYLSTPTYLWYDTRPASGPPRYYRVVLGPIPIP